MAEKITDEMIDYVSILAKLDLDDRERDKAREDMQKMLNYIDKLNELDTVDVEPLSHILSVENVFREDVVTNGDDRENILANAPEKKDGQFQVPKTVE
jgi:aspartyl-tRNA(Asn)/glutamyl-tRNA(Gln) amidotransferase subunit C